MKKRIVRKRINKEIKDIIKNGYIDHDHSIPLFNEKSTDKLEKLNPILNTTNNQRKIKGLSKSPRKTLNLGKFIYRALLVNNNIVEYDDYKLVSRYGYLLNKKEELNHRKNKNIYSIICDEVN